MKDTREPALAYPSGTVEGLRLTNQNTARELPLPSKVQTRRDYKSYCIEIFEITKMDNESKRTSFFLEMLNLLAWLLWR